MIHSTTAGTILFVDDCAPLCELIEVVLGRAGYRVFTATSGVAALRIARKTRGIDLLLSDFEMPGIRGCELAARFSRLHPAARVVFIGSAVHPIATTAPCEYLAKPFHPAELRNTVRRALRARPSAAETPIAA